MFRLRWGGLEFVGDDGEGPLTIEANGLTGFIDGVDTRFDRSERAGQDGGFPATGYLTEQMGSISGQLHATSTGEYEHTRMSLSTLPVRTAGRMSVQSDYGNFWCMAQRWGKPDFAHDIYGVRGDYRLRFLATDPRWFGETRLFGPGESVYHYGNHEATPKLSVRALTTMTGGYTVVGPGGRTYVVMATLPAGSTDVIDMESGWLYRDGVLQIGAVARADIWTIPPGQRVAQSLVPAAGTGELSTALPDTFA